MGKVTGFMEYTRELPQRRDPALRIKDWFEIYQPFPDDHLRTQAARCMDCGVPFCHTGCPLTNIIPDWNDLVYRGQWKEAVRQLHATNNFPEFTGRICPAPCEASCVLGTNEPAVTIKQIAKTIIEHACEAGYVAPEPAPFKTGKRAAAIGSGPAGLAAGKSVIIMGGGDTGADCLGTRHRHGAKSVTQFELLPKPPDTRSPLTPWPMWPMQLRIESSHEEGGTRDWSVSTVKFSGDAEG